MYNEITIFSREVALDWKININRFHWGETIQGHRFWQDTRRHKGDALRPRDRQWLEGMNRYISNAPV
jgi:hypothetical protein